jgi:hypothetical protein
MLTLPLLALVLQASPVNGPAGAVYSGGERQLAVKPPRGYGAAMARPGCTAVHAAAPITQRTAAT